MFSIFKFVTMWKHITLTYYGIKIYMFINRWIIFKCIQSEDKKYMKFMISYHHNILYRNLCYQYMIYLSFLFYLLILFIWYLTRCLHYPSFVIYLPDLFLYLLTVQRMFGRFILSGGIHATSATCSQRSDKLYLWHPL